MSEIAKLRQYAFTTLERDLALPGGRVLPAGSAVLLLPQTTADSVRVPGNRSLAEAWEELARIGHSHEELAKAGHSHEELARTGHSHEELAKAGHTHPQDQQNLADYAEQLTRYADRLTKLEAWAAANGYKPGDGTPA